jgi:tetratricopeptide (TPR) repeat protein
MVLPDHKKAIDVLATARNHSETIDDQRGISDYFDMLGRAHRKHGNSAEALAALNKARAICITLKDDVCTAKRTHTLGIVYRTYGLKLKEAVAALNEAGDHFKIFGPPYYIAETRYNLGIAHYMQQDYEQADDMLAQAYDSYEGLGNSGGGSWCLFHRGELNRKRGHFEEANNFFEMAKGRFEKVGWTEAAVYCLLGRARTFVALHEVDKAYQSCQEALTKIGNRESYDGIKEAMRGLKLCI